MTIACIIKKYRDVTIVPIDSMPWYNIPCLIMKGWRESFVVQPSRIPDDTNKTVGAPDDRRDGISIERDRSTIRLLGLHRADERVVRGRGTELAVHRLRDPGRDLRCLRQRPGDHRLR